MSEPQCEPMLKVPKTREDSNLHECILGHPIIDDLDVGYIYMTIVLIHSKPHILNSLDIK